MQLVESFDRAAYSFGLPELPAERVVSGGERLGVVEHWRITTVPFERSGERAYDVVIVRATAWYRHRPKRVAVAAAGGTDVHGLAGGVLVDEDHPMIDRHALSGVGGAGVGELDPGRTSAGRGR